MANAKDWEQRLDDHDEPVYPIGVVADLLEVSVQVIRRYDDDAMVEPERSEGGQRRYSRRDIARLAHILQLADEGISTAGIKRILVLEEQLQALDPRPHSDPGGGGADPRPGGRQSPS